MTYLSIVMTSRNDNYGGNLLPRMKNSLDSIKTSFSADDVEIILVDWNPPENKPSFNESLILEKSELDVKVIQVSNEIHQTIENSDKMPIFEYLAKNVGIRRAKGEFVLSTNPDIIFSVELTNYFKTMDLRNECFYRIDRYDLSDEIPTSFSYTKKNNFSKKNVSRIRKKDFIRYKNFGERVNHLLYNRLKQPKRILHNLSHMYKKTIQVESIYDLHLRASGDFLLMSKNNWFKIKGYPELNTYSHLDGYGCALAVSIGLEQVILKDPYRIYHQTHEIDVEGRPKTSYHNFIEDAKKMIEFKKPFIYNRDNWGLNNYELSEYFI